MHTGSDILDVEVFLRATEIMFETAKEFKELDYVDFGSGFKVPYKADDVATDVEALGKDLSKRFNRFCDEYGKELTLVFEPGKFLVSEAGYFVARAAAAATTTPEHSRAGGPAWQAAMSARMAYTSMLIDDATDQHSAHTECEWQWQALTDYLNA